MPNVNRKAPDKTHTQSLIFKKDEGWTESNSRKWCEENDYYIDGHEETEESHRWRQYDPDSEKFRYRNKEITGDGKPITLVIGFLKGSEAQSQTEGETEGGKMDTKIRLKEGNEKRWFSTGFTAGGVASVDSGKHALNDAVVVRCGEAVSHDLWIDDVFCQSVVTFGNGPCESGLKARFGHPNMCSEALGTFLGRWKGFQVVPREDKIPQVCATLHLSSTAAESPKGDLRKYVEEMAAKEPQHFGASLVFSRDAKLEREFILANGATEQEDKYGKYCDISTFKSPDPANVKNLPHARIAELHAADLVDDPAATGGMFGGAAGLSLAAQMTEWLDTHPDIFKALTAEPELLDIVTRYSEELKPFLARYQETLSKKPDAFEKVWKCSDCGHQQKDIGAPCAKCGSANVKEVEYKPAVAAESAPAQEPAKPPAELVDLQAKVAAMDAQSIADKAEIARLTGELAEAVKVNRQFAEQINQANEATAKAMTDRDEALSKIAAIEKGAAPLSAAPAPTEKESAWKKAQKSKGK